MKQSKSDYSLDGSIRILDDCIKASHPCIKSSTFGAYGTLYTLISGVKTHPECEKALWHYIYRDHYTERPGSMPISNSDGHPFWLDGAWLDRLKDKEYPFSFFNGLFEVELEDEN